MHWLFLLILCIATIAEITSTIIEKNVMKYFDSALVKETTDLWQRHEISFQNMLSLAMSETYGFKGMNVYIKRPEDRFYVSKGYYHTDNQVHVVFQDMRLEEFPHISDPVINFPITSNVIKLEAIVSKMIIHANYIQFRNSSNIVYDVRDQDSYKTSPFLFEQVKSEGELAITVDGCKLSGIGITSLAGRSVSLGNTVFRLHKCQYNFEIFSPEVASPPVVANYLPYTDGLSIDHLVMLTLGTELIPKLQAALHTCVNTSAVFQENLPAIRSEQEKVFEQTTNYVNNVIRNLNVLTITRNAGKVVMDDFRINWNDTSDQGEANSVLTLNNMILTGLETVYSSHSGGPFKLNTVKISEELRFGTLQVRGSIDLLVADRTLGMYDFAVEINDVDVDVTFNLGKAADEALSKTLRIVEVMGWRTFHFSSPGMTFANGEAIITGYLLAKLPIYLTNHLNSIHSEAILEADKEYSLMGRGDKLILEAPKLFSEVGDEQGDAEGASNVQVANVDYEQGDLGNEDGNIDDAQGNVIEGSLGGDGITSLDGGLDGGDEVIPGDSLQDEDGAGFVSPSAVIEDEPEIAGPAGSLNDEQGIAEPENAYPDDPGDQQELQAKFFDDSILADAQKLG